MFVKLTSESFSRIYWLEAKQKHFFAKACHHIISHFLSKLSYAEYFIDIEEHVY